MRALARAGDKDGNERVIGRLLSVGVLSLDFGFTAYATNAYIKVSAQGMQGKAPNHDLLPIFFQCILPQAPQSGLCMHHHYVQLQTAKYTA